jgi:multiple sugar transport system permease protein
MSDRAVSLPTQQVQTRPGWLQPWLSRETGVAWLFILPSLVGFLVFYAWPALRGLQISFTDWNLLQEPNYVGLNNYQKIIADPQFWQSLGRTVYYVLLNIPSKPYLPPSWPCL